MHQFTLKVDPFFGTGNIMLDGQAIFLQSQLQICATQNFFDWYQALPGLMFAEVNDDYSVTAECLDIQYDLLCEVFRGVRECQSIQHIPVNVRYSTEQRFSWLTEVAGKCNVKLSEVPKFSIQAADATGMDVSSVVAALPAFYRGYYEQNVNQVNVWLATQSGLTAMSNHRMTNNDVVLCDTASQGQNHSFPVLYRKRSDWSAVITVWIDQMILLPYILYWQETLLKQNKGNSFEKEARIKMLSRDEPYVKLTLPDKMEIGTSCSIALEEFPSSNLSLRISDPNLLAADANNRLQAQKTGHVSVMILSENGNILQTKDLDIYRVNRVTSISLSSAKGNMVLVGDTFTIHSTCRPQGAQNLSKAVWSASPADLLNNIGGGRFSAKKPGTCTITLTVEKVSQSIQMTVIPLATGIQLPPEVRVKYKGKPLTVSAALLPKGSACREIRCSIADRSIAQWNAVTKTVIPIAEGKTHLNAVAIGPNGNVLFQKSCPVIVLPEKTIFTPPALLTLAICFFIIGLLIGHTEVSPVVFVGSLGTFLASCVVNVIPWFRKRATVSNKIQTIISAVGCLLSMVLMIAFLSNR